MQRRDGNDSKYSRSQDAGSRDSSTTKGELPFNQPAPRRRIGFASNLPFPIPPTRAAVQERLADDQRSRSLRETFGISKNYALRSVYNGFDRVDLRNELDRQLECLSSAATKTGMIRIISPFRLPYSTNNGFRVLRGGHRNGLTGFPMTICRARGATR